MDNLLKIFDFLHQVEKLKSTLRCSWVSGGRQESSAEHSWRLALMTFLVAEELKLDLNVSHCVKLALVHDVVESVCGDVDALDIATGKVSKEKKQADELAAIHVLKGLLPDNHGMLIFDLWSEYENAETKESLFVKALDKIETMTQLVEAGHIRFDYPEFIANYPDKAVNNFPELKPMLKLLKDKLKLEFEKGGFEWKPEYD